MRNVIVAVMISILALAAVQASQAAEDDITSGDNWPHSQSAIQRSNSLQNRMFEGINLTEHQRQQMRDLMQLVRYDNPSVRISELESMHNLITAEKFDEKAVRAQAEKMAQEQITRQVEMAKVRNQMFRLLTPEQQAVLNDKHRQRMQELRELDSNSI
ncbi:cell-envelope stress modulator CpxP [Apirhabdus apintestini]|nr:cell-envelope stress modulator CpxP [Enterobacteriaceae bacterium CA-0114]